LLIYRAEQTRKIRANKLFNIVRYINVSDNSQLLEGKSYEPSVYRMPISGDSFIFSSPLDD